MLNQGRWSEHRESATRPPARTDTTEVDEPREGSASILMVLTREMGPISPSGQDRSGIGGRLGTLRAIIATVGSRHKMEFFLLKSLLEQRAYVRCTLGFLRRVLFPVRKKWPLQCVLYDDNAAINALLQRIRQTSPSVIYFDSVRCYAAITKVREAFPTLRLISDFDDLMSRRINQLADLSQGFGLGYMRKYVPGWLRRPLEGGILSKQVFKYEAPKLLRCEQEIMRSVQGVVLVSSVDAAVLIRGCAGENHSEVTVAPPPFAMRKQVEKPAAPYRFVFIGSDELFQNRLTIEWLLKLWKQGRITQPLHICGRRTRNYDPVEGVFWEGFVEDVADVYTPHSILLSPSFLPGGVKTKICEALSYGVIPLGNKISFEGIDAENNGLAMSEDELIATVRSVEQKIDALTIHARRLQVYLTEKHGVECYESKWRSLLTSQSDCAMHDPKPAEKESRDYGVTRVGLEDGRRLGRWL